MWLEHCLLWRTSERHFMCGASIWKKFTAVLDVLQPWKPLIFFGKCKHLQSLVIDSLVMVWFSCYFWGVFWAGLLSSQSFLKDPEVKSLHGSFTPNMRCMPLQHYLEHWFAWPCYGAVVLTLGFEGVEWPKGHPPLFFGEPFHLHSKGLTILGWSSLKTSQILPPLIS